MQRNSPGRQTAPENVVRNNGIGSVWGSLKGKVAMISNKDRVCNVRSY